MEKLYFSYDRLYSFVPSLYGGLRSKNNIINVSDA